MSEKPQRRRTWNFPKVEYDPNDLETYQRAMAQREQELLLPWVNQKAEQPDEIFFATDRILVGIFAWPYLYELFKNSDRERQVLEIGGGEGRAILHLISLIKNTVPALPATFFTMTSLTEQPEHEKLTKAGVTLQIPQIAEQLPSAWTNGFDIIMTSSLFAWARIQPSIPEIQRVLKPGGYWVALEAYDGVPSYSNQPYQDLINETMAQNQMVNSVTPTEKDYWEIAQDKFAVVYQKPTETDEN